jgi:preprotein translocase SecF subunit
MKKKMNKFMTISVIAAVLTMIGYSVNDSIVVSDRIREDVRKMRKESYATIVNQAINKTLSRTMITSLTVLFVTLALLIFGAASIKDFAFIMTVGTITGTYAFLVGVGSFEGDHFRLRQFFGRELASSAHPRSGRCDGA